MKFGNIIAEMYKRIFNLRKTVKHKSVFLFGPRQTGKSSLVRQSFPDAAFYDLLEADTFRGSAPDQSTSGKRSAPSSH